LPLAREPRLSQNRKLATTAIWTVVFEILIVLGSGATNEDTNELLRQSSPKRTSAAEHTPEQLDRVATKLNKRPTKTLGFMSSANVLAEALR
jgi:hypothetical protein